MRTPQSIIRILFWGAYVSMETKVPLQQARDAWKQFSAETISYFLAHTLWLDASRISRLLPMASRKFLIQKMCCVCLQNQLNCDQNGLDCYKNWLTLRIVWPSVSKIDTILSLSIQFILQWSLFWAQSSRFWAQSSWFWRRTQHIFWINNFDTSALSYLPTSFCHIL